MLAGSSPAPPVYAAGTPGYMPGFPTHQRYGMFFWMRCYHWAPLFFYLHSTRYTLSSCPNKYGSLAREHIAVGGECRYYVPFG